MSEKIIIIGNGFIGSNLYNYFSGKYNTMVSDRNLLDINNEQSIKQFLSTNDHSHIIYAAGIKDVKYCETHRDDALFINGYGVHKILQHKNTNSKLIYISTDYVFDGNRGNYTETDFPNPLTFYGKSKLIGEFLTRCYTNNNIVIRTSGVYGKKCPWMSWLIQQLQDRKGIECYSNVINSPTYAINLAEMIDDICINRSTNFSGMINLSGPPLNRYQLYQNVARAYNMNEQLLYDGFDTGNFPRNISLNTDLYNTLTHKTPNDIKTGLERLINEN